MKPSKLTREEQIQQDARDLERLGYAQQLFREMGGFSNFAISFSIISILTGAVLLYGYGLKFAGPLINTVGWPLVSLFTLCVAASIYIVGAVTRIFGLPADQAVPVFGTMTNWYFYVFVMVLIMIPQIMINV